MSKETDMRRIRHLFGWWISKIKLDKAVEYLDLNKVSEDVAKMLLNSIYNYELINLNLQTQNHEAIDLGDKKNGIAFQVTSTTDYSKFDRNLDAFAKQYKTDYPKGIRFLILSNEKHKIGLLKGREVWEKIDPDFKPHEHILTEDDLVRAIDELYTVDKKRFQRVTQILETEIAEKKEMEKKKKLLTHLPPYKTGFVGRNDDLKQLSALLGQDKPVVLVNGLGGIGKTELCKWFFLEHYGQYDRAAWVNYFGSIRESLVSTLAEAFNLSAEGTMDDHFKQVINGLRDIGRGLLLVVDNIENPEDEDLEKLLALPGTVLVNSRLMLHGFQCFNLDFIDEASCVELFYRFYKQRTNDDSAVSKLIALCGGHTLTVELLARTTHNAGMTASELLELLRQKGFDLSGVVKEGVRTYWRDEKTTKPFFKHLETLFDISGLSKDEEWLLMNLSVLPSQYMARRVLRDLLGLVSLDVVNRLVSKGWLQESTNEDGVIMHKVVREVLRRKTNPSTEKCVRIIYALGMKLYYEPGANPIDEYGWVAFAEELLMHIHVTNILMTRLANNLSLRYLALGQVQKAFEFLKKNIPILEQIQGKDDPDLATSYNNISMAYLKLGQPEKALEYQEKAIEIRQKVLDKNHPDLAQSYHNLSSIYQDNGKNKNALAFQRKSIRILEKVMDKAHPLLAQSYIRLSSIYQDLGKPERALRVQEKAIKIVEAVQDKNHPLLAQLNNNLSRLYKDLGKPEKALEFQTKVLMIRKAMLDKNHPDLATSYNNLSVIYQDLGQPEKALEFQTNSLKIKEAVLGTNHPDLATSYNNLSLIYQSLGKPERALEFQTKAIKIMEAGLNKNHPNLATSYNNLSLIYQSLKKPLDAMECQMKALKIYEGVLDKNHPILATSYANLSMIYLTLGQPANALGLEEKVIKIREAVLDNNHPDLATSYNNLSMIYKTLGQPEKALVFQEKAMEIRKAVLDKNHPDLAQSYNNISGIYQDLGNLTTALEYSRKAVSIYRRRLPKRTGTGDLFDEDVSNR